MSWSVNLFVNLAPSIEILSQQVDKILGIGLKRVEDDAEAKYEYFGPDFIVDLYANHELENDRDMNFQDYSFQLSLQRLNIENPDQSRDRALHAARTVFDELKKSGQYQLMLVENVQKKLDSFDPKHT